MSTRLYKLILDENGGDETCLQVRVWKGTPWIADAWVGELQGGNIHERERDMLLWCDEQFGQEAYPFGDKPRAGRWKRGGATVFGWAWFGFSTEEEMDQFIAAWPSPQRADTKQANGERE